MHKHTQIVHAATAGSVTAVFALTLAVTIQALFGLSTIPNTGHVAVGINNVQTAIQQAIISDAKDALRYPVTHASANDSHTMLGEIGRWFTL